VSRRVVPITEADADKLPDNQKMPPSNITGTCKQCGKCCRYSGCVLVDAETGRCPIWKNRPIACRMWPNSQANIVEVGCGGFVQTGL